ncbi:adenosylcobinamide-phosphate synthase CbiB [Jannaschia rubra]|uniref:Cobalamin biosynthesis protein CobD n=1 Tax=Jannaschia rubra TaxID=282197 RepID=A0A0M6XRR8_9RHOB|nr:adenosylcobinamide-phosphate synthase CbiB [Jannaschia rubra]CTQ33770.1 cobalamin biosynthesis protein [Jannaschia rubra]SFG08585.1 adenosylcobinamide-phosphate synthase [Jannaschia rubra]
MILAAAMILDAVFGEPEWLWSRVPHPAVVMGRAVEWCDGRLNRGDRRQLKGVVAIAGLLIVALILGGFIAAVPDFGVLEAIAAATLLAQRSLADHVRAVATALRDDVGAGRQAVARIVGRDVTAMEASQVSRAAIESAAENLSDGVIAPAFWFVVGGLPGMLAYKVVNTADSMIGYRTPRHEAFGWAAARLDDVMNWVPARLTALLILLSHLALRHWHRVPNDARQHRSPNAGWPEAAAAPLLDLSLAGPRSYDGRMQDFPWVNPMGRKDAGPCDIDRMVAVLWRTWGLALGIAILIGLL